MRVVDTSVWIEWFIGSTTGRDAAHQIPARDALLVLTIVQIELAKWLWRESGEDAIDPVLAYTQKCLVVPLDTRIALRAVELHRLHHLATADAIVYATAREANAELLTCDAHFEHLPGVLFHRKTA